MIKNNIKLIWDISLEKNALLKNLKVSLFVGIILNFINQGGKIMNLEFSSINFPKIFLTFLVPFLVSLYSSTAVKMKFLTGDISPVQAKLICSKCLKTVINVSKGESIKECPNCQKDTKWKISN